MGPAVAPHHDEVALALRRLENFHDNMVRYWQDGAPGWAPAIATEVLTRSRLDRQASLCACLHMWSSPLEDPGAEGKLVLAWTHLGSLVEGTLKFFLSVYAHDYGAKPLSRRKKLLGPDELSFDQLRQFFQSEVWLPRQGHWDNWLGQIQFRRNAIHAYRDRDVGTHAEFLAAIVGYAALATALNEQLPYSETSGGND